jgi:hypothetical protein
LLRGHGRQTLAPMKLHEKGVRVLKCVVQWKYSCAVATVVTVDFVFECGDNVGKKNKEEFVAHSWP